MGDLADLGLDRGTGPPGLAAGQGGGEFVQFLAGLGQGGAVEAAGLMFVELGGMGQDRPAPGAVDGTAGVVGGQAAEPGPRSAAVRKMPPRMLAAPLRVT